MMLFYVLLSFVTAVVYLVLGAYVISKDRVSWTNRIYVLTAFLSALFSCCYAFFFTVQTREQALLLLRIGSVGWILLPAAALYFTFFLTKNRLARRWWLPVLIFTPYLVLVVRSVSNFYYASGLVHRDGIWYVVENHGSPWMMAYYAIVAVSVGIALIMIARWGRRSGLLREKRQARVVILANILNMGSITVWIAIRQIFPHDLFPEITQILSLFNAVGVAYAISRYKMMHSVPSLLSEEILSKLEDFVVLLDPQGRILRVNARTLAVLGFEERDLSGRPAGILISEENLIREELSKRYSTAESRLLELNFRTREGEEIPVRASSSRILDEDRNLAGLVLIGHDRVMEIALGQETRRRQEAETGVQEQTEQLRFLSRTALGFIELRQEENLYHYIAQKTREILPGALILALSSGEYQGPFQVESVAGEASLLAAVREIISGDLDRVFLRLDPEAVTIMRSGRIVRYSGTLYQLFSGLFAERKCSELERKIGLREVLLAGFLRGEKLYGGLIVIGREGLKIANRSVADAFLGQASIALQRKKAEELLYHRENLYQRIMEISYNAVVIHSEGKVRYANAAAARILKVNNVQDVIGGDLISYVHPDSRDKVKERIRGMYMQGSSVPPMEEKFVCADGTIVDVEVVATGFVYLDKPAVLVIFREISERKREEHLISELKRQMEFILGATQTGLDIIDDQYNVVYIDPEWKKQYGDASGRKCYQYFMGRDSVCPDCGIPKARETGQRVVYESYMNREKRWVQVTTIPYQDQDGKKLYAEVNVDITERKASEERLRDALTKIGELNKSLEGLVEKEKLRSQGKDDVILQQSRLTALQDILRNISHIWKEPLNSISLQIQSLRSAAERANADPALLEPYVERGLLLVQRLAKNLDTFSSFLKPDRVKQRFSVPEAVDKALALAGENLKEAGIRIETDLPEGVYARGLMNEFTEVVINLLNNSRDAFLRRGTSDPYVSFVLKKEGDRAVLTLTDNGGGIPDKILSRIFEPSFSVHDGHAGIGLFLCREFVEKDMDGRITVRNTRDGVEVRIELPSGGRA